jgi:hypothetical protein
MCTACTGADAHVMIWVVIFPNETWHGNLQDIYFCILCVMKLFGPSGQRNAVKGKKEGIKKQF